MPRELRILYVGAVLPARSETFVYRELFALRELGLEVLAASVHQPQRALGEARLDALAEQAIGIYGPGAPHLLRDALLEMVSRPLRSVRVLLRAGSDAAFEPKLSLLQRVKVLWQALSGLALARRVHHHQIDHIHAHMAHVPTTIAMYAAMALGVPLSFTGHAADIFRSAALLGVKLERAAFVACISLWHRSFYKQYLPLPDEKLPLVRCGVDPSEFAPAVEAAQSVTILAVGRLVKKKGFDVLIRAVAKLAADGQRVRCQIVGAGPERGELDRLRRELAVADHVRLLGARSNEQVRQLIQKCRLFVLPCQVDPEGDRDGIPVVLMEAMACNVGVVSGDLPAIRELIEHDVSGVLVDPGNVDQLALAISSLLADDSRLAKLAVAGRERVAEEFSLSLNAQRIRAALESVHRPNARKQGHDAGRDAPVADETSMVACSAVTSRGADVSR